MKVEDLEKKKEITPETQAVIEKMFYRRHKDIFKLIRNRMSKYNMSIDDLKEEINNKKSPFSYSQRLFIIAFQTDFLERILKSNLNQREIANLKWTSQQEETPPGQEL